MFDHYRKPLRYWLTAIKKPHIAFIWITVAFWCIWCVLMIFHKFSKICYWNPWNRAGLYTVLLLIGPLAIIWLTAMLMRLFPIKKSAWFIMAIAVLLVYLVLNVFAMAVSFLPVVSTTDAPDNYLLPDRDRQIPAEVIDTFPKKTDQGDRYWYYRKDVWRKADNDCCIALAHYAHTDEIRAERYRLSSVPFLHEMKETWDGYRRKEWNEYQIFVGEVSNSETGYVWVLLSKKEGYIIYYYRPYSNAEDKLLSAFLQTL